MMLKLKAKLSAAPTANGRSGRTPLRVGDAVRPLPLDYEGKDTPAGSARLSKLSVLALAISIAAAPGFAKLAVKGLRAAFSVQSILTTPNWLQSENLGRFMMSLATILSAWAWVRVHRSSGRLSGNAVASASLLISGLWWLLQISATLVIHATWRQ